MGTRSCSRGVGRRLLRQRLGDRMTACDMRNDADALNRLRDLLSEALDESGRVHFSATNSQHMVAVALNGTILEYGAGIIELLQAGNTTAAFVILRSALEAHADIAATAHCADHPDHMLLEFLVENRRALKNALAAGNTNPYLQSLRDHPRAAEDLQELEDHIASLKAQGVGELRVREHFTRGDQLDMYEGPYALLCRHSHNNIGILERRHVQRTDTSVQAYYFQEPTDEDVQTIIDTLAGIAANSIATLVALTTGSPPDLPAIGAKLESLRELWRPVA